MAKILILVGTESGNAQMVADAVRDPLVEAGHEVAITDKAAGTGDFAGQDVLLICSSTHGNGDIPTNILSLHDALDREGADLSPWRYGVIALGDQTYADTFCFGGKRMDALFEKLGARRIGARLEVDASTQPLPDEEALVWARDWVALV
jgi:MioC protein